MSNNGGNMGRNNGGRPGVKTYALEFCEPVIANAVIFVMLILLDLWSQTNSLIPIHAIAGIVAVLLTFALCRSSYVGLSWGLVIIPAVFLIITFINTAQKSATVQALEANLKYGYDQTLAGVKYGYDAVDRGYDALSDRVDSLNQAGQQSLASVSNAWMTSYNALVNSGVKPAQAAIAATAENGKPAAGTAAATTAAASGANTSPTVMAGEFNYLCSPAPTDATLAAACQKCTGDANPDKCISIVAVNAVCLGNLATGGAAPSSSLRDACLSCTDANKTTAQQDACRAAAMKGVPAVPSAVTITSNPDYQQVTNADGSTTSSSVPSSNPFVALASGIPINTPTPTDEELKSASAFLASYPDILSTIISIKGSPATPAEIESLNKVVAIGISQLPNATPASMHNQLMTGLQMLARMNGMQISGFQSGSGSGPAPADPSASAARTARAPVAATAETFRNF